MSRFSDWCNDRLDWWIENVMMPFLLVAAVGMVLFAILAVTGGIYSAFHPAQTFELNTAEWYCNSAKQQEVEVCSKGGCRWDTRKICVEYVRK